MGRIAALVAEKERIQATPPHAAKTLAQTLNDAGAAALSAADTAEQVERSGLAVPFSLQQRVRAELAIFEPAEPEGGMTDDELERLSLEYEEEIEGEVEWLEQRREEVSEMHQSKEKEKRSD
jgi:hypothetical protein